MADAPAAAASGAVAGLFGKLPAHGDFVRRGWPDDTVDAVDRLLTETIRSARLGREEDAFRDWMYEAPLWRAFVPAGRLGPLALHVGVAPSQDTAGRLFALAAGVAGDAGPVWAHAQRCGGPLDDAVYDALAGADADATVAAIAATVDPAQDGIPAATSVWWNGPAGPSALESDRVDAGLLARLFGVRPA